ncbi:MAG TPA: tail fiber assembly protein [Arsenophonus sp.]
MSESNDDLYYFSKSGLAWLAGIMKMDYIKVGSWSDKAKHVPYSVHNQLVLTPAPTGKMLGANENGDPIWVDIPPRLKTELFADGEDEKRWLMQDATRIITPLQDAVDFSWLLKKRRKNSGIGNFID